MHDVPAHPRRQSASGHALLALAIASLVTSARAVAEPAPPAIAPDGQSSAGHAESATESGPQPTTTDDQLPTTVEEELESITPGVAIKRELDRWADATNLRFGIAHTMLFQQATGGPGTRHAASGDLDLLARWTAIGAGTKDTGVLVAAGEYRYQIGDQPPSALGGQIGTLVSTTNGFSERPMVVKELYWDQRLFDDRVRFGVGRIDAENMFGGHRLQSANMFFLNKAFSSNPAIAFPGTGLAAALNVKPAPWWYVTAGITDANGSATTGNFEGFFRDHEYLLFTEAALLPTIEGLGAGRYRLALWQIDAREAAGRPSDSGITLSCDQNLGESWLAFFRYGYADADVTNVAHSMQCGAALRGFPGKDQLFGLAAAWSAPADDRLRAETTVEVFQRLQLTGVTQLTLGVQMIVDPGRALDDDVVGVFSVRLRITF